MQNNKVFPINVFALICAIWFALTSWIWVFYFNVIISFPFGILGYFLWKKGKAKDSMSILNKMALGFLIAGLCSSILILFFLK